MIDLEGAPAALRKRVLEAVRPQSVHDEPDRRLDVPREVALLDPMLPKIFSSGVGSGARGLDAA
jgi:hypothetical protein